MASRTASDAGNAGTRRLKSTVVSGIPHVRQKPDFCGEACAEMFLRKLGRPEIDQNAVFDVSGLDPLIGRGCYTRELVIALRNIGFQIGQVWFEVQASQADVGLNEQFYTLHNDLLKGIPSIVCMHYDDTPQTTEHFRLIVGYDRASDEVIYHEPAVEAGAYRRMKRDRLLKLWPLKYQREGWTVIRMPLHPRESLISFQPPETFTSADYAQHMRELRKPIPDGFHIVLQPPFVVIGDESPDVVKQRSVNTVKWSVDRLKKD